MNPSRAVVLAAVVVLGASCGSEPAVPPLECGTNLATDEELALTPREDDNLEQLAIVATMRVVMQKRIFDTPATEEVPP